MKLPTLFLLLILTGAPRGDAPLYWNDFSKAELGKLPDAEFLALSGSFAVKDFEGDRVLELASGPLDSFGMLFGPSSDTATCTVSARIWAATTGRRFPEFGIGSNDAGGYKLWLMPRRKQVVIRKGDETVETGKYERWRSSTWTQLRLQVTQTGEQNWVVRGKAWPAGGEEPKDWSVSFQEKDVPAAGRASVWGNTYSGLPIRFDDLRATK
jgi:hypothetical protein